MAVSHGGNIAEDERQERIDALNGRIRRLRISYNKQRKTALEALETVAAALRLDIFNTNTPLYDRVVNSAEALHDLFGALVVWQGQINEAMREVHTLGGYVIE